MENTDDCKVLEECSGQLVSNKARDDTIISEIITDCDDNSPQMLISTMKKVKTAEGPPQMLLIDGRYKYVK